MYKKTATTAARLAQHSSLSNPDYVQLHSMQSPRQRHGGGARLEKRVGWGKTIQQHLHRWAWGPWGSGPGGFWLSRDRDLLDRIRKTEAPCKSDRRDWRG